MSVYNIPRCLVRMKFQSQEPIIFVPFTSSTNEDSGNFNLIKFTRWLFQYLFMDGNNYLHMSNNGKKWEE